MAHNPPMMRANSLHERWIVAALRFRLDFGGAPNSAEEITPLIGESDTALLDKLDAPH